MKILVAVASIFFTSSAFSQSLEQQYNVNNRKQMIKEQMKRENAEYEKTTKAQLTYSSYIIYCEGDGFFAFVGNDVYVANSDLYTGQRYSSTHPIENLNFQGPRKYTKSKQTWGWTAPWGFQYEFHPQNNILFKKATVGGEISQNSCQTIQGYRQ